MLDEFSKKRKAVFDYSTDYTDYIACCKKIFSEEIIEKAILFQNAIRENERNILFGYPKAFFIIGTGYPTLHEIYLDNGREKLQYTCYDKDIRSLYIESEEMGPFPISLQQWEVFCLVWQKNVFAVIR